MSISAVSPNAALAASVAPRPGEAPQPRTGITNAAADPASHAAALTQVAPGSDVVGTPLSETRPSGIQQALDEVREALAPVAQNLRFSLDEDSGRTVIKIVDSATDEVIKQIPSEEILAIAKALDKLQGVLIRQQA